MKMQFVLAAALGVAGMVSTPVLAMDESGFEVSVSALNTHMDGRYSDNKSGDVTRVSDHDQGWAVAGAWRFNPAVAVELEYADHGRFDGFNTCPPTVFCIAAFSPEQIEAQSATLSVLGQKALNQNWSLFGRLGWAETRLDRRYANDLRDDGGSIGAGIRWAYRDVGRVLLEYRSEAADMNRVGLSFNYAF